MEKKYKCEKCNSATKTPSSCCGVEKKEEKNNSCHNENGCKMNCADSKKTYHIKTGIWAGVVAGIVFGALMGMMSSLPMIASLVGSSSIITGIIVHLIISAIIGALFGVFFGHKVENKGKGIVFGLIWGFIWWILGPLFIMPLWLGMGTQFSLDGIIMSLGSLAGHLVFGFILGLTYSVLAAKATPNSRV